MRRWLLLLLTVSACAHPKPVAPPDLTLEEDEDEEFEEPSVPVFPEPEVPPPPAPPPGVTAEEFRRGQLDRARAALQNAERTVGQTSRRPPKSA